MAWIHSRLGERVLTTQVNFVVGGGAIIDAFRQLDSIHTLDPVDLHWRCVAALRHTSEIFASLIPNCTVIDSADAFRSHHNSPTAVGNFVIVPGAFYNRDSGDELPCDWTTTSDSIAALLAVKLNAEQLILLKSCDIPQGMSLCDAAAAGIVDPVLPTIVDPIRVEIITLQ